MKMKRFFALMLALALSLTMLQGVAFGAMNITISDVTNTLTLAMGGSYDNSNSNGLITAGEVAWSADGNTLTLTNAKITGYVKIVGAITINLVGTNTIDASTINTASDTVNGALHVTGATTIQGGSTADSLTATGGHPHDGIFIGASSSSSAYADQALTIKTATITATGGTSDAVSGRNGISCGSLTIENATVNSTGGDALNNGDMRSGGHGIRITTGTIDIDNTTITAKGGQGNNIGGGGSGVYISEIGDPTISNTKITVTGGNAGASSPNDGGSGLCTYADLTLDNCEVISATGGRGSDYRGGYGIYAQADFTITNNTTITKATGGNSTSANGGHGIFVSTTFNMTDSTINTVTGGDGGKLGGNGIYITSGDFTLNNSTIGSVTGGNGNPGYHNTSSGIYMDSGSLTLTNGSSIKATGGNAPTGTAGHGVNFPKLSGVVELNDTSQLIAIGGNAPTGTAGHGVNGAVTLNSNDIGLLAIGGTGSGGYAWGLSEAATLPSPIILTANVALTPGGLQTEIPLEPTATGYVANYFQNCYVRIGVVTIITTSTGGGSGSGWGSGVWYPGQITPGNILDLTEYTQVVAENATTAMLQAGSTVNVVGQSPANIIVKFTPTALTGHTTVTIRNSIGDVTLTAAQIANLVEQADGSVIYITINATADDGAAVTATAGGQVVTL